VVDSAAEVNLMPISLLYTWNIPFILNTSSKSVRTVNNVQVPILGEIYLTCKFGGKFRSLLWCVTDIHMNNPILGNPGMYNIFGNWPATLLSKCKQDRVRLFKNGNFDNGQVQHISPNDSSTVNHFSRADSNDLKRKLSNLTQLVTELQLKFEHFVQHNSSTDSILLKKETTSSAPDNNVLFSTEDNQVNSNMITHERVTKFPNVNTDDVVQKACDSLSTGTVVDITALSTPQETVDSFSVSDSVNSDSLLVNDSFLPDSVTAPVPKLAVTSDSDSSITSAKQCDNIQSDAKLASEQKVHSTTSFPKPLVSNPVSFEQLLRKEGLSCYLFHPKIASMQFLWEDWLRFGYENKVVEDVRSVLMHMGLL
jgi:hypothetical protein